MLLWMDIMSAFVTCLSPMALGCSGCYVVLIPGALNHACRLCFFKVSVSGAVEMVFGLEHGWCGVTNKIRA